MTNFMMDTFRATSIALAVLMIGTAIVEAADANKDARDQCKKAASEEYEAAKKTCDSLPSEDLYKHCVQTFHDAYVNKLVKCANDYPSTKPVAEYGVGGPSFDGLDGWHPKGPKTKGLSSGQSLGVFGGDDADGGSNSNGNGMFNGFSTKRVRG